MTSPPPDGTSTIRNPRPPSLRRSAWVPVGLVVLAGWAALVALTLSDARADLRAAETAFTRGRTALADGSVEDVDGAVSHARDRAYAARAALGRPHVRLAGWVPFLGNSVESAIAVADATSGISDAVVRVTGGLRSQPGGSEALTPRDGRLPVDTIAALSGPLDGLVGALDRAEDRVEDAPRTWLVGEVRSARDRLLASVEELRPGMVTAAGLADQLPGFLGNNGTRRYLLAAANPAETRATAGFLGAFTVATFDRGALSLEPFRPIWELPSPAEAVAAPDPEFAERYGDLGATRTWANVNLTPHFPWAATVLERLWEDVGRDPVDGTIVVDPFALRELLLLTGPVTVPETGTRLDHRNVVAYVTNRSFAELDDPTERKEVVGDVARAALEEFMAGASDAAPGEVVRALSGVVTGRHLLLHSRAPTTQEVLERTGLAGALEAPAAGDPLAVTFNSASASKVDFYLEHAVIHEVRLGSDGGATVRTSITLRNGAPTEGQPARVIGPSAPGLEAGDNRLMVSVYCGTRCRFTGAESNGDGSRASVGEERGQSVATTWVTIPAGGTVTLRYGYETEHAWYREADGSVYRWSYRAAATVKPRELELALHLPDGWALDDTAADVRRVGDVVRWSDHRLGDAHTIVRLVRDDHA